jgi:hypothetical protein
MKRLPFLLPIFCILSLTGLVLAADPSPTPTASTTPRSGDADPANTSADRAANADPGAEADVAKPRKITAGPTAINIIPTPGGVKTLNIHFRWSLFPDASIEVRLVPGTEDKGIAVAPIYFHEHLKGKVQEDFFDCLDHPDDGGKTHSFTKDKTVYKMIGRQNSLGNHGVHVNVSSETPKKSEQPAAVYLQLDMWAVDKETLSLDLPRDEFAQPGALFVWFFRGNKVVWEEQVRWPGYR